LEAVAEVPIAYEKAYGKNPKNEDLLVGVFAAYVRLSDFQKQKDVTIRLLPISDHF
jgi:hypothetical protein